MNQIETLSAKLGAVTWEVEGLRGYVTCPGAHLHTSPTKERDTLLFLDKVPTIYCVHSNCRDELKKFNTEFRIALKDSGKWKPAPETKEEKERRAHQTELHKQARRLMLVRDTVIKEYAWPTAQMMSDSPAETKDGWRQILSLFAPSDYVWIGEPHHSGRPENCVNFRHRAVWQQASRPLAPFICANPFKGGSIGRTKDRISELKHTVVECDSLHPDPATNREMCGAVFKYILEVKPHLHLKAVVDAGNKSLHGWFGYDAEAHEWATHVLPSLGVDPATLRSAQPVRVPGWYRSEKNRMQSLLYFNP